MTSSSSPLLSACRTRRILTTPLLVLLLLFQSLHGSLLQAQHIANLDFSLSEIRATAPDAGTVTHTEPTEPGMPTVLRHDTPDTPAPVSDQRRAEVMAQAADEQYLFHPDNTGGFTAANPTQRLDLQHSGNGLTVSPRPAPHGALPGPTTTPDWTIRFETTAIDLDALTLPLTPTTPSIVDNMSSWDLAPGCNEWFVNRSDGIKHGYTVQEPATGHPEAITVRITAHTDLTLNQSTPNSIEFLNGHGHSVALYRDLYCYDQLGNTLPSAMTLEGDTIILTTEVHDAVFPVTIDPFTATQQGNSRMASDGAGGDGFGSASAGHGDFTAIGAPHKGSGKVYLQQRNQGGTDNWGEHSTVEIPASESPGANDRFGASIAMGEDETTGIPYLAVGAPEHGGCGAVFIFYLVLGVWTFLQKIAPTTVLTLGARFGCALAMFGTMLAIGARAHLGHGAVFIYTLGLTLFALAQTILSPTRTIGHDFGFAVALFGTFLLIGAPGETVSGFARAGAAYLYTALLVGALFPLSALKFFAAHPAANDEAGSAVAVNHDSVAIGIPYADGWPGNFILNGGLVLIFALTAIGWGHRHSIFGTIAGGLFGFALAMNYFGSLAVGSPEALTTGAITAGLVFLYLFNKFTGSYESGQKIIPTTYIDPGMRFGASVLLLGTLLFAMATNYNLGQGAFFLFLLAATLLSFGAWQLLFWSQATINDPKKQDIVSATADPDGDRIPNFLEYLLYLSPLLFNLNPLNPTRTAGGSLRLVFPISLVVINALLILQYALTLGLWTSIFDGPLRNFFTLGVLYPGIQAKMMVLTLVIALAGVSNFFFRYRAEERL